MSQLLKIETARLYAVSETPNAKALYGLEPFESDDFNKKFDFDNIDDELKALTDYLFDGGEYFQITDEDYDENGNVSIQSGDDSIEIPDIVEKIETDPDRSTFYIVVDRQYTEYRWVVAEMQGTSYQG